MSESLGTENGAMAPQAPEDTKPAGNLPKKKPGVCMIKAEYIDHNHVRELVTDYLPTKAVEAMKEEKKETEGRSENGEPPAKKAKIKGRNKDRPRERRQDASERLCPAITHARECRFGDKCKFLHDINKYMESKPADLGEKCHLYRTYGRCNYGVTCRFAKDHISDDFKNLENEELVKKYADVLTVSNIIDKDLQKKLWKRKYNFKKAEKCFQAAKAAGNTKSQTTTSTSAPEQLCSTDISAEVAAKPVINESCQTKNNNSTSEQICTLEISEEVAAKPVINEPGQTKGSNSTSEQLCSTDIGEEVAAKPVINEPGIKTDLGVETKPEQPIQKTPLLEKVVKKWGPLTESVIRLRPEEKKKIDFSDKLYLAPLTTVGNLPFRRVCKSFGVDITCGEMALATNLLQGQQSEWALLKRHESEDIFGAQVCGSYPDSMSRVAQLLCENTDIDFIDINCGCPIDLIFKRGEGSALMGRHNKLEQVVKSMIPIMDIPLTLKMRTGIFGDKNIAHTLAPKLRDWGIALCTLHGRSREQRYTKLANWDYIEEVANAASPMPFFGNGDILSYEDAVAQRQRTGISGLMIARGALIKPWIFTEIKEQRHWDISASERLDMLRQFVNAGLEHWGSDQQGIANTRRFLLEWLSFLYRYIPVGILERVPQHINEKPPYYFGRNDLETLMASSSCTDWIKITELLLGPVPDDFTFLPKHRANSYS